MNPIMNRLSLDHKRLAQLLKLFDHLLDRFHEGEEPDYELMSEMLEYMESYQDTIHHPTEELIFRRALDRGVQRHDVFDVLTNQHDLLPQLNRRFRQSLEGIVHEVVLPREEVEAQGRELVNTLRQHLTLEDREAFPIAMACLDASDWEAVEAQAPSAEDPLFGVPDPVRFRSLFQRLCAQA
jgi:hemerythrin-like domain-containing protein